MDIGTGDLTTDTTTTVAASVTPTRFARCADLHRFYPHGVGGADARDRVRGSTQPVTTFKVSTRLYNRNRHLDGAPDGVACERL